MKNLVRLLSVGAILFAPLLAAPSAYAASASMSLSPSSSSVTAGNNLTINIFENSGAEPVNGATAHLSYPTGLLDFVQIISSSGFNVEAASSGGGGTVKVDRGANPPVSGNQLVGTVIFKAKGSGAAAISFTSGTYVVSANTNSDILNGNVSGGSYTVNPAPTPPPAPSPSPSPSPSPAPSPSPSPSPTPSTPKSSKSSSQSTSKSSPSPAPAPKVSGAPVISDVSVSNIGINTATVSWTTSTPSSSEVDYGNDTHYVLTAVNNKLVTSHKVALSSDLLSPGVKYHFAVKSVDSSGRAAASGDQTFKTKGATLVVTVIDQHKKPVPQAKVSVGDATGVTDNNGQATLTDLAIGKTVGVVNYKGKQTVVNLVIKPITSSSDVQKATLTIKKQSSHILFIILPLLLLAVVVAWVLRARGGNGGNEIKDLRGVISGNGKSAGPPAGSNTKNSPPPTNKTASGPTIVRPTIPPRG